MIRLPLSLASPAGPKGRLSILIFHRVLPEPDPLFPNVPSAAEFESRMRWIRAWFNVMPLGVAIARLYAGTIPARALAITFDDGYADNEAFAAPILKRLGLTATFFIASGFLSGGCMFNDRVIESVRACSAQRLDLSSIGLGAYLLDSVETRRLAISSLLTSIKHHEYVERQSMADEIASKAGATSVPQLMMSPDQVRSLRAQGMDIGGHTVMHPILTRLSSQAAFEEIRRGKAELEQILRAPVELFAYPNGIPNQDYTAEHARMVRECGFNAAVSTAWGAATSRTDRFQLPRFTPWDRTKLRWGARLLANSRFPVVAAT
jgi:peptidoglycan/xylan/chitin deacetylase (PgdA/CDA1 family)